MWLTEAIHTLAEDVRTLDERIATTQQPTTQPPTWACTQCGDGAYTDLTVMGNAPTERICGRCGGRSVAP